MRAVYKPEKGHQRYVLKDGTEVKGASTIAKVDDEMGNRLAAWANKLGRQNINSSKYKDATADAGNAAHFMIQCHFQRKIPDFRKISQEAVDIGSDIFNRFMNWWVDNDLKWIASELELVSELYRYGGTTDLVASDHKDRIWLMDVKTSKGIYFNQKTQLAGLGQLWNENCKTDAVQRPHAHSLNYPEYHKLMIIRLPREKDCDIDPVPINNPTACFEAFLAQLAYINAKTKANGYKE